MKNVKFSSLTKVLGLTFPLACALCLGHSANAWAKDTKEKIKEAIDDSSDAIKKAIDKCGNDLNAIQSYLNKEHPFKGVLQDTATVGPTTLSGLSLNDRGKVIVVRPGEKIHGTVRCTMDRNQCKPLSYYRVVIGYKGIGGQTTIGGALGSAVGDSVEKFMIYAPQAEGFYQVRFKTVEGLLESTAINSWEDTEGNHPDSYTTIGVIYVKQP